MEMVTQIQTQRSLTGRNTELQINQLCCCLTPCCDHSLCRYVCCRFILTSQTKGAQAAVGQLDVGGRRQLLAQLHHHAQRGLAPKQDHLQISAEQQHILQLNTPLTAV